MKVIRGNTQKIIMSLRYECFFGEISSKIENELIELYEMPINTIKFIKQFTDETVLNCFAIYNENTLIHLIVFKIDQHFKTVYVLNKLFEFDIKYLKLFSNYIFNAIPKIDKIKINYLFNPILQSKYLFCVCKTDVEDYILKLPSSNAEYIAQLTTNMRRHTKNYISKIERTFGSYSFRVIEKEDVSDNIIIKIVEMNHLRMNSKKIISGIDSIYTENIIRFVKIHGLVSVLEINNEIVAGLILYTVKNNYVVETLSSNPEYNQFNVGHTCLYMTINECINRKGNEFHLLWGNNPYKKRFLAERVQLYTVTVFRTKIAKLKFIFINKFLLIFSSDYLFRLFKNMIKRLLYAMRLVDCEKIKSKVE